MIFTPFPDEQQIIKRIHKVHGSEYVVIRMTLTMIEKNNIDTNDFYREMLENASLIDYDLMEHGSHNGISEEALFIEKDKVTPVKLKFYKVNNNRGDRRFSIETLRHKTKTKEINEGDLLYFSVYKDVNGNNKLFIINLTNNTPDNAQIVAAIGKDNINSKLEAIMPKLQKILNKGWIDNYKGAGQKAAKDIGDTFESELSIEPNNIAKADIDGLIEIKTKGESKTLDTLFTLRPCFEGTRIADIEPNDRNRVSAFTRYYGYESDNHPNAKSLYITIGSKGAPHNNQGFYLDVDDLNHMIKLVGIDPINNEEELTAFWHFDDLKHQLEAKHPSTLWVSAKERQKNNLVQFKYTEVEFSRAPQFMTFLSLIKSGDITYDWRGYTTKTGTYSGKNHGNAWRIKPKAKANLFGELEKLL